jgi:hypothetical protein
MAGIALVSKTPSTQLACNLISRESFRTAVPIMMGRRAAKIANRKVLGLFIVSEHLLTRSRFGDCNAACGEQ